ERWGLEGAQRAIPHQRPASLEYVTQCFNGLGADVEDHLVSSDLMNVTRACARRIGGKLLRHHDVIGQMHRAASSVRGVENFLCLRGKIMFAKRLADINAPRGEKGVGHAAADDEVAYLGNQMLKDRQLGRYLGSAHDCGHRRLRITESLVQSVEFRLHGTASVSRQEM